jgi:hypothetical protein
MIAVSSERGLRPLERCVRRAIVFLDILESKFGSAENADVLLILVFSFVALLAVLFFVNERRGSTFQSLSVALGVGWSTPLACDIHAHFMGLP